MKQPTEHEQLMWLSVEYDKRCVELAKANDRIAELEAENGAFREFAELAVKYHVCESCRDANEGIVEETVAKAKVALGKDL